MPALVVQRKASKVDASPVPCMTFTMPRRNLLEKKDPSEVTLEEAKEAIRTCVRTLFYRDCRSTSRYMMAVVSTEGAAVEKPTVIDSNWEIANFNLGYE